MIVFELLLIILNHIQYVFMQAVRKKKKVNARLTSLLATLQNDVKLLLVTACGQCKVTYNSLR